MATVRWLTQEQQRAWRAYISATQLFFDQLDRELQRDAGINHGYYEILVRLSEAEGRSMRMSDLAASSLSSRSRLSHAVSRLEELGWVRRESCVEDRRGQVAVLTDEGYAKLVDAAPGHVTGVREHLVDVLTAEQLAQLREISEVMLAHLAEQGVPDVATCAKELSAGS